MPSTLTTSLHPVRASRAARPALLPQDDRTDYGRLLLRLLVGGLMLFHGVAKLSGGLEGVEGMLSKAGLPAFIAYGALVGELLAPLLVIIGAWTRPAALVMALNMLVAIALAHAGDVMKVDEHGGWALELQAFYLFGALGIALLGAGRFSAGGEDGRMN